MYQQQKPFDLDEELRKLQEIKLMRERQVEDRRNQALKKKQDEINNIFFKKELRTMKDKQHLSRDKYSFYHNETVRKEEQALKNEHQKSAAANTSEIERQEPQFKVDNGLNFFRAEEHKSDRVDSMDRFMNALFRLVAFSSFSIIFGLFYMHIAQKNKAGEYAQKITQKIQHGGGQAVVQADNSIAIYMDSSLVEVIPS